MKIVVIGGSGYVGLTTAVCLASKDHLVFCVGRNKETVDKIREGLPIIYEENLEDMLKDALQRNRLIPTTDLTNAIEGSYISFTCWHTQQVGWEPKIGLEEGLKRTVSRYRNTQSRFKICSQSRNHSTKDHVLSIVGY